MPTPSENVQNTKPIKLTAYNIFHQIVTRIRTAIEIFDQGFWLGILNDGELDILTDAYYCSAQTYYDNEYNESGFFDWEKQVIKNHFSNNKNVLVAACGGGREIIAFAKAGYQISGFESNKRLVVYSQQLIKKNKLDIDIAHSPAGNFPGDNETYGAVIIGWGAYTHIAGQPMRLQFLQQAGKRLEDNGLLLLSFWVKTRHCDYYNWIRRLANTIRIIRFWRTNLIIKSGDTIGEFNGGYYSHSFSRDELEKELNQAGFSMLEFHSKNANGYAVARKNN